MSSKLSEDESGEFSSSIACKKYALESEVIVSEVKKQGEECSYWRRVKDRMVRSLQNIVHVCDVWQETCEHGLKDRQSGRTLETTWYL